MNIQVLRFSHGPADTLGLIFIDGDFVAYSLEDEYRVKKKPAETRIPEGNYRLGVRDAGNLNKRHRERYGALHQGMIHVLDVPEFEWIYFHAGNRHDQTEGCILVGDTVNNNQVDEGFLSQSRQAYIRFYNLVIQAVKEGKASLTVASL